MLGLGRTVGLCLVSQRRHILDAFSLTSVIDHLAQPRRFALKTTTSKEANIQVFLLFLIDNSMAVNAAHVDDLMARIDE